MAVKKQIIPTKCAICKTDLWFTESNRRNYRYVIKKKKGYYVCNKCNTRDLK